MSEQPSTRADSGLRLVGVGLSILGLTTYLFLTGGQADVQHQLSVLASWVVLLIAVGFALALAPRPETAALCPVLVFAPVWGVTWLFFATAVPIGWYRWTFYLVGLAAGAIAGMQTNMSVAFIASVLRSPRPFALLFPLNLVLGVMLYGIGSSMISFGILGRMGIAVADRPVINYGIWVGLLASVTGYLIFRGSVRFVWRY